MVLNEAWTIFDKLVKTRINYKHLGVYFHQTNIGGKNLSTQDRRVIFPIYNLFQKYQISRLLCAPEIWGNETPRKN